MKRLIQYVFIGILLVVSSCKKDDTRVFSQSADVRIKKALSNFQMVLDKASDGWVATIATEDGGGYSFWMQFDDRNRVKMLCDFDSATTVHVREGSFRLKALQQPTLIFDTYSYIHLLADPNANVNGGSFGAGLVSDFEFYVTDSLLERMNEHPEEVSKMTLIGRYNDTKLVMRKASADEKKAYLEGDLYGSIVDFITYLNTHPFIYLKAQNGTQYQLSADVSGKKLTLTWVDAQTADYKSCNFAFTLKGIEALDSLPFNGSILKGVTLDKHNDKLISSFADGAIADVLVADKPIIPAFVALGATFNTVLIPIVTSFPGWSADFATRFHQVTTSFGNTGRTFEQLTMNFNTDAKTMDFVLLYLSGSTRYNATYSYNYTMTNDGKVKFTLNTMNGNANTHRAKFNPILADRLEKDTFQLDYYVDPDAGILASFTSIEHPDFAFTGGTYNL
ncbi:DUF4302 domain-containing protein [Arachidicoccus terrestris]|uniref:DUF4302 domain-containing protein n=1 Tax=Arachidicoccus terrestris TaxID=2875539 RepID=UPI001CC462EE|nr:DUF4302 domain-containing protein [Arachidicoccus terrestris]UAY56384.1 DUF4302 domain-containing protein [Arachidicoccus terrestris]